MYAGSLKFYTFVSIPHGDGFREKRALLATAYCEYADAEKKLIEFRQTNAHIREIHAKFEYSETIMS